MRKNRTAYFLIIVFITIIGIFYVMINRDNKMTIEEVESKTLEYCKDNNFEDASNFINKELSGNSNCTDGTPGTEGLKKLRDRILKVKDIK